MKIKITMPTALVALGVIVAGASVVLFGRSLGMSEAAHDQAVVLALTFGTILVAAMRQLLTLDANRNGIPDRLEGEELAEDPEDPARRRAALRDEGRAARKGGGAS